MKNPAMSGSAIGDMVGFADLAVIQLLAAGAPFRGSPVAVPESADEADRLRAAR